MLLSVEHNARYGYIDPDGSVVVEPRYEWAGDFSEGYACVLHSGNRYSIFNEQLEKVGQVDGVRIIDSFSHGLVSVTATDEKRLQGYADVYGQLVIYPRFFTAYSFDDVGAFAVEQPGQKGEPRQGRINGDGEWLGPERYRSAWPFADSGHLTGAQSRIDYKWHVINKMGQIVVKRSFYRVLPEHEGYIVVKYKEGPRSHGWIDRDGETVVEARFDKLGMFFKDGLIAGCLDDRWGILNVRGEWVLNPQYELICDPSEGIWPAITKQGTQLYGCINTAGEVIVVPRYEVPMTFRSGVARVWFPDSDDAPTNFGYIRKDGTSLWPPNP